MDKKTTLLISNIPSVTLIKTGIYLKNDKINDINHTESSVLRN